MYTLKKYDIDDLNKIKKLELMVLNNIIQLCEENNLKYYLYGGTALGAIRHEGFIPWDDDVDIAMFREDYEKLLKIMDEQLDARFEVLNFYKEEDYFLPFTKVYLKGTHMEEWWVKYVSFNIGIFIDIFPLDNIPDSKFKYKIQYYKCRLYKHLLMNSIIKIKTKSRIANLLHSLIYTILKIIPISLQYLKKKYIKSQIKYNDNKTTYATDFFAQCGMISYDKRDFDPPTKVKFESISANVPKNYDKILKQIYGNYMELPPEEERYNHTPEVLDFGKYK